MGPERLFAFPAVGQAVSEVEELALRLCVFA
jgi:hypothetical protein